MSATSLEAPAVESGAPLADAPPAQRADTGMLALMAALTVALHLPALTRYGWFRDELYYMASTSHLDPIDY